MEEKITVIVPVYNVAQYLIRCLDSIQNQSYRNLEIILVDDGSLDNCPKICEDIKQLDSRVKVIHKENGGLGFARNSGLDIATGEYVTFIDSDDWISENHIENLYCAIRNSKADVAIGSYSTARSDGTIIPRSIQVPQGVYEGVAIIDDIVLPLIGADLSDHKDVILQSSSCMNLYRMSVITENKLRFFSERVAVSEDLYFNIDYFCRADRIVVVDEVGYFYFENMNSISRKYDPRHFERTLGFYKIIMSQVEMYGLKERISLRVERTFLLKIRVAIRLVALSDLLQREKYREIRQILNHELVQSTLWRYPIDAYIPVMCLLAKLMRSGNVRGVYWLVKIREAAKKTAFLKVLLKQMGIGK